MDFRKLSTVEMQGSEALRPVWRRLLGTFVLSRCFRGQRVAQRARSVVWEGSVFQERPLPCGVLRPFGRWVSHPGLRAPGGPGREEPDLRSKQGTMDPELGDKV